MKEIEHFRVVIKNNITTVERDRSYINFRGDLKQVTSTAESKNAEEDTYDKKIGIVVAILKSLGYSRRVVGKISDILLEENKRFFLRIRQ